MSSIKNFNPERIESCIRRMDGKAFAEMCAGLQNLSASMRRDEGWRVSAIYVAEASWAIEKLFEALQDAAQEKAR